MKKSGTVEGKSGGRKIVATLPKEFQSPRKAHVCFPAQPHFEDCSDRGFLKIVLMGGMDYPDSTRSAFQCWTSLKRQLRK